MLSFLAPLSLLIMELSKSLLGRNFWYVWAPTGEGKSSGDLEGHVPGLACYGIEREGGMMEFVSSASLLRWGSNLKAEEEMSG